MERPVRRESSFDLMSEPKSAARQTGALTVREGEDRPA